MRSSLVLGLSLAFFLKFAVAGAWGTGSFDNDDALDWLNNCARLGALKAVTGALANVSKPGYIEAPEASSAIAAAEVVAAAVGNPPVNAPPEFKSCVESSSRTDLARLAPVVAQRLERVLDPSASELAQSHAEVNLAEWQVPMRDLLARLRR
jgi:hypothetical protein